MVYASFCQASTRLLDAEHQGQTSGIRFGGQGGEVSFFFRQLRLLTVSQSVMLGVISFLKYRAVKTLRFVCAAVRGQGLHDNTIKI